MEIGGKLQQVFVHLDQDGLVAALKEMADALLPAIYITGVAEREVLEEARQRNLTYLHNEVDVIGHQAVSMDPAAEPLDPFLKKQKETGPVTRGEENVFPGVSPEDYVVESAGINGCGVCVPWAKDSKEISLCNIAGLTL